MLRDICICTCICLRERIVKSAVGYAVRHGTADAQLLATYIFSVRTAAVACSQKIRARVTLVANVKCFNLTYNLEIHLTFSSNCNCIL